MPPLKNPLTNLETGGQDGVVVDTCEIINFSPFLHKYCNKQKSYQVKSTISSTITSGPF